MSASYKLVVCDVDGTLVNDRKEVSPLTREAIELFRRQGGEFSLATGRIEKSVAVFCRDMAISVPVILYNGAKIYHPQTREVIRNLLLSPEEVNQAAAMMLDYPFDFIFYSGGEAYILRHSSAIGVYEKGDGFTCVVEPDISQILNREITKILMIGDNRFFSDFREEFTSNPACRANLVQSEPAYLEILPQGVNKGDALKVLADHLNLSLDEIICFGDNLNDLEMIQEAGIGVAMANGREEVRQVADIVAPTNNEDGVGTVLKSILEGKNV